MKASCYTLSVTATDMFISMKVNVCDTLGNEKKIYSFKNQSPTVKILKHIQRFRSAIITHLLHILLFANYNLCHSGLPIIIG